MRPTYETRADAPMERKLFDIVADVLYVDDSKWALTIKKAAIVGGFVRVEVAHA